jgi:hypothetical protein
MIFSLKTIALENNEFGIVLPDLKKDQHVANFFMRSGE